MEDKDYGTIEHSCCGQVTLIRGRCFAGRHLVSVSMCFKCRARESARRLADLQRRAAQEKS